MEVPITVREETLMDQLLKQLHPHSPYGKDYLRHLLCYETRQALEECWALTVGIEKWMKDYPEEIKELEGYLVHMKDLRRTLDLGVEGSLFDEVQLFELKILLMTYEKFVAIYNSLHIQPLPILKSMNIFLDYLDPSGDGLPTFFIDHHFSNKMGQILTTKWAVDKALRSARSEETNAKQQWEEELHDGQQEERVLLEQRRVLLQEEELEKNRILRRLTQSLRPHIETMMMQLETIGQIDFYMAKVVFQWKYPCCYPTLGTSINFQGLYHPIYRDILVKDRQIFQPIDLQVDKGVTVITGPNMGGKTLVLKSLLLNLTMGLMGFCVFAKSASIDLVAGLSCLFKDGEDAMKGLSSFGAEICTINALLPRLEEAPYFFVIDEFARGTNPMEGKKLTRGLLEYLNKVKKGYGVITTHYDGVIPKEVPHYQVKGLKSCPDAILPDQCLEKQLRKIRSYMDYQLEKVDSDKEVPKDGLKVARLLGIDQKLLEILEDEGGMQNGDT